MSQLRHEQQAIDNFVSQLHDLDLIEAQVGRPRTFNIFEALGATRQELRHSDFLAFLLDPQQTHGLGDAFLRAFLRELASDEDGGINPAGFNGLAANDLSATTVRREWQNIDILLLNVPHHLVILIENKIDSTEHGNQLDDYYRVVQAHLPGWTTIALYLTPDGDRPTDPRYRAISYGPICQVVENLVAHGADRLEASVRMALQQYVQMLRRHVVADGDSELARVSRRVYREHEQAINAIMRYRQQRQRMIRDYFEALVATNNEVRLDQGHTSGHLYFSRFAAVEWYTHRELLVGAGWTKSKLVLLFQFIHSPQQIGLDLAVGPGPTAAPMRQRLFDLAGAYQPPFIQSRDPSSRHFGIYDLSILPEETGYFEDYSDSQIKSAIRENWDAFCADDFPQIRALIRQHILETQRVLHD